MPPKCMSDWRQPAVHDEGGSPTPCAWGTSQQIYEYLIGRVAELADATDLKSVDGNIMRVRTPPRPFYFTLNTILEDL